MEREQKRTNANINQMCSPFNLEMYACVCVLCAMKYFRNKVLYLHFRLFEMPTTIKADHFNNFRNGSMKMLKMLMFNFSFAHSFAWCSLGSSTVIFNHSKFETLIETNGNSPFHSIPFASFHHQQPAVKSPQQFHINHLNGMNSISSWYSFIKLCVYTHQRYIMHSSRATSNKSHWRIVRKPIIIGHLLVKWQTT